MRILIIGYMHPKKDKRVFRTVETLSKEHQIIYQYLDENGDEENIYGNVLFVPVKYKVNINESPIKKLTSRKPFDEKIMEMIENYEYDIVYFHHFVQNFPIKAFKAAKKRNKTIIYDIHEYHPENFLNNFKGILGSIKTMIMGNIFKQQLQLADKLIFVSTEMQHFVQNKFKVVKPTMEISNYANKIVEPQKKSKEIVFVGKVTRGIDKEIEIIKKLQDQGFKFKVIGMDSDIFHNIKHEYTGFLPYEDMMKEISKAAFSLVCYNTTGNKKYKNDLFSLPHKYYDSIAAGTPVITKLTLLSLSRAVKENNIGVVIEPDKVDESVERILNAYENYDIFIKNINENIDRFHWNELKKKDFLMFVEN